MKLSLVLVLFVLHVPWISKIGRNFGASSSAIGGACLVGDLEFFSVCCCSTSGQKLRGKFFGCGCHRSAVACCGEDWRLSGVFFFCGGCVSTVSVVAGLSCGGHRRRGYWCPLLPGTSAFSVIVEGSVVVAKVVDDLGIVAGVVAENQISVRLKMTIC